MNKLYNTKYEILGSTIKPNPTTTKYWADLASNPNGGDLKYFNGEEWVLVNNQATTDISKIEAEVNTLKSSKVDKVEGKQLSTNDYTTEEKNKLSGIQANANNYVLPAASTTELGGVKKLAAIEDLAGEADINAVIATVNELLAGLRTAGIVTA